MSNEQTIAERVLECQAANGEKTSIKIQIFKPIQLTTNKWTCGVAVIGLYEERPVIEGVDSFQALNLAFSVIKQGLEQFLKSGGKLYWEDGSGELTINDIFA